MLPQELDRTSLGRVQSREMENGIAVHVEIWLAGISRSRGTKAKIRNIMSDVCSHAIRYGWMKQNAMQASPAER
jgi:hypothetical protein